MRAFVTGATGFLGQRLVHELLAQGAEVRCLVRAAAGTEGLAEAAGAAGARLEFVRGSLEQLDACADAFEGCEVVFHVAAAMRGAPAVLFLNNVTATRRLIEVASRAKARRLVLVSSLGVYGTGHLRPGDLLDEVCPLDPEPHLRDGYSFSKIAQEKVAWEASRAAALPLVVVRPGVIYGPGRDCLGNRVGLRLGRYLLRMGGRQRLPYTYVDNCAHALYLAGTVPAVEGEAFNIVDDDLPTAQELLGRYRREVERVPVLPIPHWMIGPLSRLCAWYHHRSNGQLPAVLTPYKSDAQWKPLRYANSKAKDRLGWQPRTRFAEGLEQTFRWLREQKVSGHRAAA